jgi:hypothetical protein
LTVDLSGMGVAAGLVLMGLGVLFAIVPRYKAR